MNELLQKHGCANVFTVPEGLRELMSDISREVLREQPEKICEFIANYLSVLLVTREHGVLAVKILDDLCDCKPSVSNHLLQVGFSKEDAGSLAGIIKEEIEGFAPAEGREKLQELDMISRIMDKNPMSEDLAAKVCQIARNAYKDYWYRRKLLEQNLAAPSEEPWEVAAKHTLDIYKKTKPSFAELTRATEKIQAAYRGYYVRKSMVRMLKEKEEQMKDQVADVELLGAPRDIACEREMNLGHLININDRVRTDNVDGMFDATRQGKFGLNYNPQKTVTHVDQAEIIHVERRTIEDNFFNAVPLDNIDDD